MSNQIRYAANGDRTYFVDGKEVGLVEFSSKHAVSDLFRLDEMFAAQRAPHGVSDKTFMADTANGKQFQGQEHVGNAYRETAEAMGGSVTGKKYLSGLAAFPGDPEAWVDSRGDAQRLLEKRGWGAEGTINVKPRERTNPAPAGPDVADDLLDKYTAQIADADERPELVDRADLREQVKERLKPAKHLRKKAAQRA